MMNSTWGTVLQEGEKILWSGKPENVDLIDPQIKSQYKIQVVVAIVWLLASFLYIPKAMAEGRTLLQIIILMLLMDCIPLLMIGLPVSDGRSLQRATEYAITNNRLLISCKERITALELADGMEAKIVSSSQDGTGHLCFGSAVDQKPKKMRILGIQGLKEDNLCTGLVFYQIAAPEKAASLVPVHLRLKGKNVI